MFKLCKSIKEIIANHDHLKFSFIKIKIYQIISTLLLKICKCRFYLTQYHLINLKKYVPSFFELIISLNAAYFSALFKYSSSFSGYHFFAILCRPN